MKKLLIFLILLLIMQIAYAQEIKVKDVPVQSVVLPGQNAIFDIELKNSQPNSDEIKAVIMDTEWRRQTGSDIYSLGANEIIKDRFVLFPLGYLKPGIYGLNVRFVSTRNPEIFADHQFVVTIVDYKEILEAELETNPQGIDPKKENLIKLNLRSRYNIDLENLNIIINSRFFNENIITNINGLESKAEEFIISADPGMQEGEYDTQIIINYNDKNLVDKTEKLRISAYENIKETKTSKAGFLTKKDTLFRKNDGNSVSNEVYTVAISGFKKLFTKFEPEAADIENTDEGYKYTWQFALNPGEEYKIVIFSNYLTPLLFILLIILIIYLYFKVFRTELYMHKKVLVLKSQEGGVAGIKVLLTLKNNTNTIKNLYINDHIPGTLEIPHEYITLKPNSIKKGLAGSTITWEIPELVKGEERVISYKLKSHTGFRGKLIFQRAACRYKNSFGKLSVSNSNDVNVYA